MRTLQKANSCLSYMSPLGNNRMYFRIFAIVALLAAISHNVKGDCQPWELACNGGESSPECVMRLFSCDGINDCQMEDATDEQGCTSCPHGFCDDGHQCFHPIWECDGVDDCDDRSDESKCNGQCFTNLCRSLDQCIPYEKVCNREFDCADGSDELECETFKFARVTVHLFSGRENVEWEITDPAILNVVGNSIKRIGSTSLSHRMGYRGMDVIAMTDETSYQVFIPRHFHKNMQFLLLNTAVNIDDHMKLILNYLIRSPPPSDSEEFVYPTPPADYVEPEVIDNGCTDEDPLYNPNEWNDADMNLNNCYNYAVDKETNTFAQPGRKSGNPLTSYTTNAIRDALISDGLTYLGFGVRDEFPETNDCLSALLVAEGLDYHMVRRDSIGDWSHKIGEMEARDTDNAGNKIHDPRTANLAPYTFQGFYSSCAGVTDIE